MLCANETTKLNVDCPVDIADGEYACVKVSNIRLDVEKIQALVEPILKKLVTHDYKGTFDQVAKPLEELDKRLPGISDLAGKKTTILDIADVSKHSSLPIFVIVDVVLTKIHNVPPRYHLTIM